MLDLAGEPRFARWAPADESGAVGRARHEATALLSVADDGVPRPVAVLQSAAQVVLLETWVEGTCLGASHAPNIAGIVADLLRILGRAHEQGWIHADVRPENIVIREDGSACIVDWELAARIDEPVPPGTLGYSPPEVWSGSELARPERDYYALAVCVWEVLAGCRAFSGDRAEVVALQGAFEFDLPGPIDPDTSLLFAAARDRRMLRAQPTALASHIDWARAIATSQLRQLTGIQCAAQLGRVSVTVPPPTGGSAEASDVALQAVAVACALSGMVFQLRHLIAVQGAGEQVHRFRDRAERISGAANALAPTSCIVVIACARDFDEFGADILERVCGIIAPRGPAAARMAPIAVDVERCAIGAQAALRCTRGVLRAAIGPLFSDTWTHPTLPTANDAPLPAPGGLPPPRDAAGGSALEYQLAIAETQLATGQVQQAYRGLVRICSTHTLPSLGEDCALRLVRAWAEASCPDASIAVARHLKQRTAVECARRVVLRALASASRFDELSDVLDQSRHLDLGCDLQRHRAILCLRAHEPARARELLSSVDLRAALRDVDAGVPLLLTLAAAARLTGRLCSARRILDLAEAYATRGARRRLSLLARSNMLVVLYDTGNRDAVAVHWEDHAAACCTWGMTADSMAALTRAGAHWVEAGATTRGLIMLERVKALARSGGAAAARWHGLALVYRTWAVDRLERWEPSDFARHGDESAPFDVRLYKALLRWELLGDLTQITGQVITSRPRGRLERLAVLIVRSAVTGRSESRVRRWLQTYALEFDDGSPLLAGLIRLRLRLAGAANGPATSHGVGPQSRLALLEHMELALALAWLPSGAPTERGEFRALMHTRGDDRLSGVRSWEWAVAAQRLCGHTLGFAPATDTGTHPRSLLCELVAALPVMGGTPYRETVLQRSGLTECRAVREHPRDASLRDADAGASPSATRAAFVTRVVGQTLDAALSECVREAMRVSAAERGVVIFDLGDGRGRARVAGQATDLEGDDLQICHSVLARADASGAGLLIDDAASDPLLQIRPSVRLYRPRSVIVVPMNSGTRRVGFVYVETRSRSKWLTPLELKHVSESSVDFGWVLEAAHLREEYSRIRIETNELRTDLVRARGLEALGRSASEVIHELRNMLTIVVGEADLLANESLPAFAATAVDNIRRASHDGCDVIGRLQDSMRGLSTAECGTVDVFAVVSEVLMVSRVRLAGMDGRGAITVEIDGAPGCCVTGIASALREAFSNLVSNSIDAMPSGGRLYVQTRRQGGRVLVQVRDTGVGMSPETASHVFEPFFTTKGNRGNGLGLAIVRGIVQRHGGEIDIESTSSAGTTFCISLPVAAPSVGSAHWLRESVSISRHESVDRI